MENQNNINVEAENVKPTKVYYYDIKGNKLKDFFRGFLGSLLIIVFIYFLNNISLSPGRYITIFYAMALFVFVAVALLALPFKRTYISLGIACFVLMIPLIFFGSCLLMGFNIE